ncbi:Ig-like domain-containing protein, partial [Clostridiaceae bacterium OttesenSCG-928-D20]|nr:Ig-like domain-containing protein [Clostridiaceae bacterium OttesenSCG-928-D20]
MGIIPQITCRRCKKKYSSLNSRCPHCGTRKIKQSSRTAASAAEVRQKNARAEINPKYQMIFGIVLVAAVIISVVAIIMSATSDEGGSINKGKDSPSPEIETSSVEPETPTPETPTPTPTVQITSIIITYAGTEKTEFTAKMGEEVQLAATALPFDSNTVISWSVSDTSIIHVTDGGKVTALSSGHAYVYAEAGGAR